jgi:hypothetical protein
MDEELRLHIKSFDVRKLAKRDQAELEACFKAFELAA